MPVPDESMAEDSADAPVVSSDGASRLHRRARYAKVRLRRNRTFSVLGVLLVAGVGAGIGVALAPPATTSVGPLQLTVRVQPSMDAGVRVQLPPIGDVEFETHHVPVAVAVSVTRVDVAQAQQLLVQPGLLGAVSASAPDQLRSAAIAATWRAAGSALVGAVVLGLLVYRVRWRSLVAVTSTVVLVMTLTLAVTAGTFDADKFTQPRFTGLLSQAPYLSGQVDAVMRRLQDYRDGVNYVVQGVTTVYAMAGRIPVASDAARDDVAVVVHVSDLHINPVGYDLVQQLVRQFHPDAVIDTGDTTTWGTPTEVSSLAWISKLGVPYVWVRGNHDSDEVQRMIAAHQNVVVLDGQVTEVAGIPIAGIGDPVFIGNDPPAGAAGQRVQEQAGQRLAAVIAAWNAQHPAAPVQVAAIHEPYGIQPLLGAVPTVMNGHFHERAVTSQSGSLVMQEGSTGGAGIFENFTRISSGYPLPLQATVLYIARKGSRAGQVVAYDEVTVGGFGLASASVQRIVIHDDGTTSGAPSPTPSGSSAPSEPGTPSGTGR